MSRRRCLHLHLFRAAGALLALLLPLAVVAGGGPGERPAPPENLPIQALRHVRVVTIDSAGELSVLPRGTVLLEGDTIRAVGEAIPAPPGAEVFDLEGRWLLPGFIDAHYLPGYLHGDANEYTEAITEEFQPLLGFDPWDPELERAMRLGVTSLAVAPGDRSVVGGQVTVVSVVPGRYPLNLAGNVPAFKASVGLRALGNTSLPRYPTSVSGAIALLRRWAAEHVARRVARADASGGIPVDGEAPGLETSGGEAPVEGEGSGSAPSLASKAERILISVETRTQAELVLRIFRRTPLIPVLLHAREISGAAWNELRASPAAILGPHDLGDPARVLECPAKLERLGVPVAFATHGRRQDLLTTAVLAMGQGLSFRSALAALTDTPARIYGLGDRLGRIEAGLRADLVLWSGNPFSLTARVEGVWVGGRRIHGADAATEKNREEKTERKKEETP